MSHADFLATLPLQALADQCTQETQRFFQNQDGSSVSCLELFRRAIISHQENAWEYVYLQYGPQVHKWVLRHPMFKNTGEPAEYFVNMAFTRMWKALNPDKFTQFNNIKEVLRYLQLCVHSVIVDYLRARPTFTLSIDDPTTHNVHADAAALFEGKVLDKVYRAELWQLIKKRLQNEKEKYVFYCCYALDMKPREIYQQYPDMFKDVREIYRIKENLLARLRRDKELQAFFAGNAGKSLRQAFNE